MVADRLHLIRGDEGTRSSEGTDRRSSLRASRLHGVAQVKGAETGTQLESRSSCVPVSSPSLFPARPCFQPPAPVLRPRDQPGPHCIPLDVPQDGQQMFVALHWEALEPSLIDDRAQRSGARPSNASHACGPANGRRPSPGRLRPARRRSASGWTRRNMTEAGSGAAGAPRS